MANPKEDTAEGWIRSLGLRPHPGLETGFLSQEIFVDPLVVRGVHGQDRNAASNVYFLHRPGERSFSNTGEFCIL